MKTAPVIPGIQATLPAATSVADNVLPPVSVAPSSATASSRMPASLLEDSMEEISMTFAEHVERKSKALNQRKVATPTRRRAMEAIERIEQLDELMKLLEHPQHAKLETLNQKMQSLLSRSPSPDRPDLPDLPNLDELLEAAGDDPVRCDIMLRHTLAQAQLIDNKELEVRANQGLGLLHNEKGAEVCAGLNTANAIATFSTDPTQKKAMRQLYYQTIVHLQSGHAMLEALYNSFGSVHFKPGLHTLQRALSDDLAANRSSIPRRALQKIIASLKDASNISQTLAASERLLARLSGKLPEIRFSPLDLARRLLKLSGSGFFLRDLQNLSLEVAGKHRQHQVLFLTGLLPLVENLPLRLWQNDQSNNRQTALKILKQEIEKDAVDKTRMTLSQPRAAL